MSAAPGSIPVTLERALALHREGRFAEAEALYLAVLQSQPGQFDALHLLGVLALQEGKVERAIDLIGKSLDADPRQAIAHASLGNALHAQGRRDEALASFEQALALDPGLVEAYYNRGNALRDLRRFEEALACYDRALQLRPDYPEALTNRGVVLGELQRHDEALASYERALAVNPGHASALVNRGNELRAMGRREEALADYALALQAQPGNADAMYNQGNTLGDLGRFEEAARSYARLVEVRPDYDYAIGHLLEARRQCCDWERHDELATRTVAAVAAGRRADSPLSFLAVSDSAQAQLECARTFTCDRFALPEAPLAQPRSRDDDRIRVAYVSADFREHALSYQMAGLLERHDRRRFEIVGVSLRAPDASATGRRVRAAFDRFEDVAGIGDDAVVGRLRELGIDIAVDLMGYTRDCRTGIFARRAAPLQVNYLGFPGTMGAPFIDYIIADEFVVPAQNRAFYAEKVVYLPDCFQANDAFGEPGEPAPTRRDAGLPERGFVFCAFNRSHKLNPAFFGAWMRLLRAVGGSVLWLVADNTHAEGNLRREAARRGVDPGRLVFAPKLPYANHLARLQLADLFLDSMPFGAGATASSALRAGVPVLACAGEAFASRMSGSLLHAIGLPELVTHRIDDYEARAIALASDPQALAAIRQRLARNRATHPLFDADRFRVYIEEAYSMMWKRNQSGQPPAGFAVQARKV